MMITERYEELADLLEELDGVDYADAADAVISSGYRKPCVITTVEELDALPEGAVVMDANGKIVQIPREGAWWPYILDGSGGVSSHRCEIELPATILRIPEES